MRALLGPILLVLLALLDRPAGAAPPKEIAIELPEELKPWLRVLTDGKGRYLVAADYRMGKGAGKLDQRQYVFTGDGKTFRRMRWVRSGMRGAEYFYYILWDPRVEAEDKVGLYMKEGEKYGVYCAEKKHDLTRLPPADEKAMIAQARFIEGPFGRIEYKLARDDRGTYYYVDRGLAHPEDFRLFVGPRGGMKLQKMKNVVRDSAGDVFASKTGELRLVLDKKEGAREEGTWVRGKKRTPLVVLPTDDNEGLIYNDLGVYVGIPYGSPCDLLGGP